MESKVQEILKELENDANNHRNILKRYKRICNVLYDIQILSNSLSIACCGSAATTLLSGVGAPVSVVFSILSGSTAGIALLSNLLFKGLNNKVKKHHEKFSDAKILNLKFYQKYLFDGKVTQDEFIKILKSLENYYNKRDASVIDELETVIKNGRVENETLPEIHN